MICNLSTYVGVGAGVSLSLSATLAVERISQVRVAVLVAWTVDVTNFVGLTQPLAHVRSYAVVVAAGGVHAMVTLGRMLDQMSKRETVGGFIYSKNIRGHGSEES